MLFRSEGHEVVPVRESEVAADMLKSSQEFDLLLTDIRMAPIDGMEIIRLARKVRPDMNIVVISAYCSEKTVKQAMALGCTTYVKKPFKTDEVLNAVRYALEKSGS
jgi:two-component system response regulator PilR (NtrC family)